MKSIFLVIQKILLIVDEAPTTISSEYFDFIDVFSPKLVVEILEHMGINNHAINLISGK